MPRETPRATETPRPVPPPPANPPPVRRPPPTAATPRPPVAVTPPTPPKRVEVTDPVVPNPTAKAQDVDATRPAPKKGIAVSTKIVSTPVEDRKKRDREQREQAEKAVALARDEAAAEEAQRETDRINRLEWERKDKERRNALAGVVKGLSENLAPGTKIELPAGPGRGGEVVMEYGGYVQTVFQAAWNRNRPGTLAAKSAKSRVALTIRRDGSFTYKVLSPARVNDVDAAIGRILAQQRRLNPLPGDLKGDDLEIIITFNLESSPSG